MPLIADVTADVDCDGGDTDKLPFHLGLGLTLDPLPAIAMTQLFRKPLRLLPCCWLSLGGICLRSLCQEGYSSF